MPRIMKRKIGVLIANASEARCYKTIHLGSKMELIKEYNHPASRLKGMDLISDRPGHFQSRNASGHGAFVEPKAPKEVEAERFAHQIAADLHEAHNGNQFDALVIIAPPHFHGLINKFCSAQVLGRVIHNLEKDYTKLSEKELLAYLNDLPHFPAVLAA